jgi:hypothetical protein
MMDARSGRGNQRVKPRVVGRSAIGGSHLTYRPTLTCPISLTYPADVTYLIS